MHPSHPLARPGFRAFFGTQLLTAFNDNFLKNAVVIWISATQASFFGISPATMISVCSAAFIAPFFVFSATAGQLADRFDKTLIIRIVKGAEIMFMVLAGVGLMTHSLATLLGALVLMGVHSSFLGPVKYSILPQLVGPDELVESNALVEMATFLAILGGTLGGGLLVIHGENGPRWVAAAVLVVAVLGFAMSFRIPRVSKGDPAVRVHLNPLTPAIEILRITSRSRSVFLSVLGISWFWFFGAVLLSLLPVYARDSLHAGETVVSVFLTMFCVGIAAGSLLTERISGKNLELALVPVGALGLTLFTLDLAFSDSGAPTSGPLLGVSDFFALPGAARITVDLLGLAACGGLFTVPLYTLIQERADSAERSRVIAGNNILNAVFMVAGSILLAVLFSLGATVANVFLVLALISAATAIYIHLLVPEFLLRFLAWIASRTMYRLEVRGHDNIPKTGGVVLVCNHVAFNDFLIVSGSVRRPVRFVMDHRIAVTPIASTLFRAAKTIPIAPQHESREVMERAFAKIAEELREGEVVCIYPEGKITKTGELNRFKDGIERIVKETPVPVVPMAVRGLWGSIFIREGQGVLRKWPKRFRAPLTLVIDRPILPHDVTAEALESKVRDLLTGAQSPG